MIIENGFNGALIGGFRGKFPKIHPSAFICEGAKIIGEVEIGENCSVWYNAVIRGDVNYIKIGARSNIQDLAMLHVTNKKFPLDIASDVTIAHSVALHGCSISERVLVGIGAIVLDGAKINSDSMIAAGALIREGYEVPSGVLMAGVPAKPVRDLTENEMLKLKNSSQNYMRYIEEYKSAYQEITRKD